LEAAVSTVASDARGVADVRIENTMIVFETLRRRGGLTTQMLCEETGLTPPTVTSILRWLEKCDWVVPGERVATGGRKARLYALNATALQCIAVDLQVHRIKAAVVDITGAVHERSERKAEHDAVPLAAQLDRTIADLLGRMQRRGARPVAVGVSLPAFYDDASDRVTFAPNIGGEGLALAGPLSGRFGLPVAVENDARAGVLAELWWHTSQGKTLAYIVADYGVGAGVAIGGEVHRGRLAAAGDIGHAVIDPKGEPCRCGQIGCLETFVSFPAIRRRLASAGVPMERFETIDAVVEAALAGDERVRRILAEAAEYLAVAASILRITLDPDEIVLGGGLSRTGDLVLSPLVRMLSDRGPALFRSDPPLVRLASRGDETGIYGAAALAFKRFLDTSRRVHAL